MPKFYTYIDLFAGCGGLSLGLHNAGWKGLFAIEKSPDAFKTLKHNLIERLDHFEWPKWLRPEAHDIKVVLKKYRADLQGLQGTVDLVAGGPPCQGFSTAGKRKESDDRNKLIHCYIEFISIVKPKMLFFENVKGFTMGFDENKSEGKKYSHFVIEALEALEYDVYSQMVNFSEFGVPQKRCRFILVGVRRDICNQNKVAAKMFFDDIKSNSNEFLVSKGLSMTVKLEDAISDLLKKNGSAISPDTKSFRAGKYSKSQGCYQMYLREGLAEGVIADSHRFVNHTSDIIRKFRYILNHDRRNKNIGAVTRKLYKIKKRNVTPLDSQSQSPTLTTLTDDYIHYCEPRVLTVREYARIQSFPDTFEFKGKYTTGGKLRVKEVPRYTQIGNAIPPLFGEQSGLVLKQLIS